MRPAEEPRWIDRLVVDAAHLDLIRTYGGLHGLRNENALESALARPRQRWSYREAADIAALAAAYGYGLARSHPFQDGNKRTSFMAMAVFLGLNGYEIEAPEADVVTVILALAAGNMTEDALADWVRSHIRAEEGR